MYCQLREYLHPPQSSSSPIPPYYQSHLYNKSTIRTLLTRLQPYNLTKAELLLILNLRPTELGLLDCIVEECDLRFSEEAQEEILMIVSDVLDREDKNVENGVHEEEGD